MPTFAIWPRPRKGNIDFWDPVRSDDGIGWTSTDSQNASDGCSLFQYFGSGPKDFLVEEGHLKVHVSVPQVAFYSPVRIYRRKKADILVKRADHIAR